MITVVNAATQKKKYHEHTQKHFSLKMLSRLIYKKRSRVRKVANTHALSVILSQNEWYRQSVNMLKYA